MNANYNKKIDIVDIYDENKIKTGKTKVRGKDVLEKGEYIIGVQAMIINSKKEILISKRSENKVKGPLMWECNGGALLSGEEGIDGIIREIKEELGITLHKEEGIFLKTVKKEKSFKDIFLFYRDIDIDEISFDDGEAIDAKWVDINEFIEMFDNGQIVQNVDINKEDYYECLNLIERKDNNVSNK